MTLTISQLQQMYGTRNVQELKGANPNAALKDVGEVGVLERNAAASLNDIIPDEDNPLFMTIEQRALAHQIKREQEMQEMKLQIAEVEKNSAAMRREQAVFETLSPEEQRLYLDQRKQKELDAYHAYQAKEEVRIEKLKASLPPRISGALGEDLRLSNQDLDKANFLEAMKVKYAYLKDAFVPPKPELEALPALFSIPSKESPTYKNNAESFDRIRTQDITRQEEIKSRNEEKMQAWKEDIDRAGNMFVMNLSGVFNEIEVKYSRFLHHSNGVREAAVDIAAGRSRPMLREQIQTQQAIAEQTREELRRPLERLKNLMEERGYETEIARFFADYTQFETGTAHDLRTVFRDVLGS